MKKDSKLKACGGRMTTTEKKLRFVMYDRVKLPLIV